MARYALIDGIKVVNIIEWDGDTSIWSPPSGQTTQIAPTSVGIGCSYIDGNFVIPNTGDSLTNSEIMEAFRADRNKRLIASDWTQCRDVTLTNDADWKTYRQALRDMPATESSPEDPTWPTKPS